MYKGIFTLFVFILQCVSAFAQLPYDNLVTKPYPRIKLKNHSQLDSYISRMVVFKEKHLIMNLNSFLDIEKVAKAHEGNDHYYTIREAQNHFFFVAKDLRNDFMLFSQNTDSAYICDFSTVLLKRRWSGVPIDFDEQRHDLLFAYNDYNTSYLAKGLADSVQTVEMSTHEGSFFKSNIEIISNKKTYHYKAYKNIAEGRLLDSIEVSLNIDGTIRRNKRRVELQSDSARGLLFVKDERNMEFDLFALSGGFHINYKYLQKKEYKKKEISYQYNKNNRLSGYRIETTIIDRMANKKKQDVQKFSISSNCDSCRYDIIYDPIENNSMYSIPDIGFDKAFWAIFDLKGKKIKQKLFFNAAGALEKISFFKGKKLLLTREYFYIEDRSQQIITKYQPDAYFPYRFGYSIHTSTPPFMY